MTVTKDIPSESETMNPDFQINSESNNTFVSLADFLRHERDLELLKCHKEPEFHRISVTDSSSTHNLVLNQKDESELNIDRAVVEINKNQNIMYLEEDSENQVIKEIGRDGYLEFDCSDSFYTIHHPFRDTGKNSKNMDGDQNFNPKATSGYNPTSINLESDNSNAETPTKGDFDTEDAEYSSSPTEKTPPNILSVLDQNTNNSAEIITLTTMLSQSSFLHCKNSSLHGSGRVTYSGNVSHRSGSSTTTTSAQSFAFPILQQDWCSSPVKMEKADGRNYRKYRGFKCMSGFVCFRF